MAAEHDIYPTTEAELEILIRRLHGLAGSVLSVQEWRTLFASVRQLLPRKEEVVLVPSEIDLKKFNNSSRGKILAAMLSAFASQSTYQNNQRYFASEWIGLAGDFYSLSCYQLPYLSLPFAHEILDTAKRGGRRVFLTALSVIVQYEPRLIRQVASRAELEERQQSLENELNELAATGEEYQSQAEDNELDVNDYDQWSYEAEVALKSARDYFSAFGYPLTGAYAKLSHLHSYFERPPEADHDDERDHQNSNRDDLEYWTIERMFEDL